ncbi:MAG: cupin domain-containing protein [Pseudomonadales bacterium]
MNLLEQAAELSEYWSPKVVGQVNDQFIKVAKLKGQFTWHKHDEEDEMFLVLQGSLKIEYEDHQVALARGDMHVVPRNTLHNPHCEEECLVALIETVTTAHTGNVQTSMTRSIDEQRLGSSKNRP